MKVVGYSDIWSVQPGESVRFMVSSEDGDFDVAMVRLFQIADWLENAPFREEVIEAACARRYPGRKQEMHVGSFLRAPHPDMFETESFTVVGWVFPTSPERGRQTIFGKRMPGGAGFDLAINECGRLQLDIAGEGGATATLTTRTALERGWYLVTAAYDADLCRLSLSCRQKAAASPHLRWDGEAVHEAARGAWRSSADLLIGAQHRDDGRWVKNCFNGKIGGPAIYKRPLDSNEIDNLYKSGRYPDNGLVARWHLGAEPFSTTVVDTSGNGLSANVVNIPLRAVTGAFWDGTTTNFQANPAHYDAIHFHDDDVEDAGWNPDFEWIVPQDLPSGVYAARLRSANAEDYVPFIVRPREAMADALFVMPTFTYQMYANEHAYTLPYVDWDAMCDVPLRLQPQDEYAVSSPAVGSIYDKHSDGSPIYYSSSRRPIVNCRPKMRSHYSGSIWHFSADMCLIDWIDREGIACDVASDHDVHIHGVDLLGQYRVILLGSHPEYFSWSMRLAFETYVTGGGKLMYLGGNGCWWVTGVDPARPHVLEVRKKTWLDSLAPSFAMQPGEEYLSTTGDRAGSWRGIGRSPEALFGVGTAGYSMAEGRGYRRKPDSFDPRVQFVFEGIGEDELIGNFGHAFNGAASGEFDRAFPDGGSPPNTLILASSGDHPKEYCSDLTEYPHTTSEEKAASIRSDLTFYDTAGGGAVFSAGSMTWCASLPWNGYENNVARLTGNVLRHFLEP